jgi:hypothetical protein
MKVSAYRNVAAPSSVSGRVPGRRQEHVLQEGLGGYRENLVPQVHEVPRPMQRKALHIHNHQAFDCESVAQGVP